MATVELVYFSEIGTGGTADFSDMVQLLFLFVVDIPDLIRQSR